MKIVFILAVSYFGCFAAFGQAMPCGDYDVYVKHLQSKYGERLQAAGLGPYAKSSFQIFSSAKGTWTILQVNTDGRACVRAIGSDWHVRDTGTPS